MSRDPHEPDTAGTLLQACMCEAKFRRVPAAAVITGVAWSHGPSCNPPPTALGQRIAAAHAAAGPPFAQSVPLDDTHLLTYAAQMVADQGGPAHLTIPAALTTIAARVTRLATEVTRHELGASR